LSLTIGYPVWPFPSSTTFSYMPRMVNVGFRFTQLVATLGPNSKDGHHRFQTVEEIAKLPAAYWLSGKAESGERYLSVTPA